MRKNIKRILSLTLALTMFLQGINPTVIFAMGEELVNSVLESSEIDESEINGTSEDEISDNLDVIENEISEVVEDERLRNFMPTSEEVDELSGYIEIYTASDLQSIRSNLTGNFKLMNDIDLEDVAWTAIGSSYTPFKGKLNGQGFKIKNLRLNSNTNDQGFFGYANGAKISNLILENASVDTAANYWNNTGALLGVAVNYTLIENCAVVGGVVRNIYRYASGMVGQLVNSTISKSYTMNAVDGKQYVGGLAGYISGNSKIIDSYSRSFVGGNAGQTYGITPADAPAIVENVYFAGSLVNGDNAITNGEMKNCFYDIDKVRVPNPEGTGKTFDEIQSEGTFDDWDFSNIWIIDESYPYPHLQETPVIKAEGTIDNPREIKTVTDLKSIAGEPRIAYILMNDIDLEGNYMVCDRNFR